MVEVPEGAESLPDVAVGSIRPRILKVTSNSTGNQLLVTRCSGLDPTEDTESSNPLGLWRDLVKLQWARSDRGC